MSDIEKAECRALGALDNLRDELQRKLKAEYRSDEYCAAFWENFYSHCANLGKGY